MGAEVSVRIYAMYQCIEMRGLSVQNQHGPQLQHSPLPLRKHFQMLSPCYGTVRGNTKQAKRKSRRDVGDHLDDGGDIVKDG